MCVEVKTLGIPAMLTGMVLAVLVVIVFSGWCYFLSWAQAKWREWHDDVVEETEVDDVVEETEVDDVVEETEVDDSDIEILKSSLEPQSTESAGKGL